MYKINKSSITGFIFIILFSFSTFFIAPQKASAQIPVTDGAGLVQTTLAAVKGAITAAQTTITATTNTALWTKEYVLDLVAYTAANVAIQTVSAKLQNMILGAANSFVKDLKGELQTLENDVGNNLGIEINAVNGCFPNLDLSPVPNPVWNKPKFQASITCSVENSQKINSYYQPGGFSWAEYRKTALNPERYNPFGTAIAVQQELNRRTTEAKQNEVEQLAWGRGLRGVKDSLTGLIKTPAAAVQKQLDNAFSLQLDRMKNADELTEVLVAIVSASVSSALNGAF